MLLSGWIFISRLRRMGFKFENNEKCVVFFLLYVPLPLLVVQPVHIIPPLCSTILYSTGACGQSKEIFNKIFRFELVLYLMCIECSTLLCLYSNFLFFDAALILPIVLLHIWVQNTGILCTYPLYRIYVW